MTLQPSTRASERPGRRRVLLVEDEPFVREATHAILESAGFEVLSAQDSNDAMQIYEEAECKRHIDLVMTDLVLPGRSGQQLGEDLRQRSPDVNVLVTSGYSNPDTIEEPASRTYFLAKPYSKRSLVEKIEGILASMPLERAAGQAG
ncbi:MAG: response regulator [Terriglobales bacterium]